MGSRQAGNCERVLQSPACLEGMHEECGRWHGSGVALRPRRLRRGDFTILCRCDCHCLPRSLAPGPNGATPGTRQRTTSRWPRRARTADRLRRSSTFQERQIECREYHDDPGVYQQPRPEVVPEEQDVHADHYGYQGEHVKHDGCLSSHQFVLLRATERSKRGAGATVCEHVMHGRFDCSDAGWESGREGRMARRADRVRTVRAAGTVRLLERAGRLLVPLVPRSQAHRGLDSEATGRVAVGRVGVFRSTGPRAPQAPDGQIPASQFLGRAGPVAGGPIAGSKGATASSAA
jgi:hypothetical protein